MWSHVVNGGGSKGAGTGEPWGDLASTRKIREYWGLLGYLPSLNYPP